MTTFFLRCEAARGLVYARVGVQSLRWRSDGGGGGTQWILGAVRIGNNIIHIENNSLHIENYTIHIENYTIRIRNNMDIGSVVR